MNEDILKDIEFPWEIVTQVTFKYPNTSVLFRTGNTLEGIAPDRETFDRFLNKCKKHLHEGQIIVQ